MEPAPQGALTDPGAGGHDPAPAQRPPPPSNLPSRFADARNIVRLREGLMAYNPHRPLAHEHRGSGHTHCAPDHSQMDPVAQETRLRDLRNGNGHDYVWMTAHSFVAPDPGVDGIEHLFGTEVYSGRLPSGAEPHVIAFLPDGSLADVTARPFGEYRDPLPVLAGRILDAGGFAALAHPTRYSPTVQEVVDAPDTLWGIEAISAGTDIAGNLAFIDARLSAGKYTCIAAGNDLHDADYGLTWGYQVVQTASEPPTREELVREVRACNFFACRTQNYDHPPMRDLRLEVDGGALRFTMATPADRIEFIGRGGRVLESATSTQTASYTPTGDEGYVRVSATRQVGEALCLSQPVWLIHSGG